MALTDAKIRVAKPGTHGAWLADRDGLYLRVAPKGTKSFYIRRKLGDRRIQKRLGRWPALSLADARKLAMEFDPELSPAKGMTVANLMDRYEREIVDPFHKQTRNFRTYKRVIASTVGHIELERLRTAHLTAMIADYSRNRPRAGDALRSTIKTAIGWAHEMGFIESNIAAGITNRVSGYTYRPRERVLMDGEIRALWRSDSAHSPLLRGLLISGLRIGELQKARWSDLEETEDGLILHIPASHSKNSDPHWLLVTDLLREQFQPGNGLLFERRSATGTQHWVRRFCEREGIGPWTPHDLRRTFATRLHEFGTAPHIVEKMLNHRMQGVMAVYNRAEYRVERLSAYREWAVRLQDIVRGAE